MTTTTTVGMNPTNPVSPPHTAGSTSQSGGFGKYLVIIAILVAVFFGVRTLMPSDSTVVMPMTDTPTTHILNAAPADAAINDAPWWSTPTPLSRWLGQMEGGSPFRPRPLRGVEGESPEVRCPTPLQRSY